jgi:hypothetical protein
MVTHCQCQYTCIRRKNNLSVFSNVTFSKIYVRSVSNRNIWVCKPLAFLCTPLLRPRRRGLLAKPTVALCVHHLPPFLCNLSGHHRVQSSMSPGPHAGPDECNPCSLAPYPQHLLHSHPPNYAGSSEWSLPFIFSNQNPKSVF